MKDKIILSQLTQTELAELIRAVVNQELYTRDDTESNNSNDGPELMTIKQIADYFGVCKSTIYNWRNENKLPKPVRKGRKVYFVKEDIINSLDNH